MSTILFIQGLNSENSLAASADKYFSSRGYKFKEFHLFKKNSSINTKISIISKRILHKLHKLTANNEPVIVIGHSLGSIASIINEEINKVTKLVLWDPSLNPYEVLVNSAKLYKIKISTEIIDDAKKFISLDKHFKKISVPTLIVGAGKGGYKIANKYSTCFSKTCSVENRKIENADHNFIDLNSKTILLKETLSFIKKPTIVRRQWRDYFTSGLKRFAE